MMKANNGYRLFLLVFIGLALTSNLYAQHKSTNNKIASYIDSLQLHNKFPGMCVSYMLPDGTVHHQSTGVSDIEKQIPMQPHSMLMSGSTPKMFYATVAMLLHEKGKINLDDKIEKYLSQYSWYQRIPNSNTMTVRQVMNHSSGIMEYYELGDFSKRLLSEPDKEWKPEEILSYVFDKEPLFEAGAGFSYADTNYFILGLVIESITGNSIFDEVDRLIIKPLSMTNTVPARSRAIKGLLTGYSMDNSPFGFSGPTIQNGKFIINPQFEWCGGGYISTTEDWLKFITGLMAGKLVKNKSLILMKNGIPSNLGQEEEYGLGLQVRKSPLGTGYGHGGWFPGYLTEVEYFPEKNIAVAIQFNTDDFAKIKGHPRNYTLRLAKLIADENNH